jgi:hypothetical protein
MSGNFTATPRDSTAEALQSVDAHVTQNELFRRSVVTGSLLDQFSSPAPPSLSRAATRVSETIPVFFVPGDIDLGTPLSLYLFTPP